MFIVINLFSFFFLTIILGIYIIYHIDKRKMTTKDKIFTNVDNDSRRNDKLTVYVLWMGSDEKQKSPQF